MRSIVRGLVSSVALATVLVPAGGVSLAGPAVRGAPAAPSAPVPKPVFAVAPTYPAGGPTIQEFVAADFDGDGDQDLANANANGALPQHGLPVTLNNGAGKFGKPIFTPFPGANESAFELDQGDFDGDGVVDLVALALNGTGSDWRIRVMLGDGDGTFTFGRSVPAADGDIAAGDVDGDGDPDVVHNDDGFGSPGMKVYTNRGDGALRLSATYPANGDFVALGDVDGDGSLDIVFDFGPIYVQLNAGNGTFGPPIQSHLAGDFCCYAFDLADWDGDGNLDIAASDASGGHIAIGMGTGDGHFTEGPEYGPLAYQILSIEAADFSGDGIPDMVASGDPDFSAMQEFVYLHGQGDGTFTRFTIWEAGGWALEASDFDGDGLIDLASTDQISTGYAFISLSEGDGNFRAARNFLTGDGGSQIESALVNDDALPDLVVALSGSVAVHLNEGNRTFGPPIITPATGTILSMGLGDLNADGQVDVVAGSFSPNNVIVMLGTGNGHFGAATGYNNGSGAAVLAVAVGDVNGDGRSDVVSNAFASLSVMRAKANGTLAAPVLSGAGQGFQTATVLADVTGDDILDAVSIQRTGSNDVAETTVTVNRGVGTGVFEASESRVVDTNASVAKAADLDADGSMDIALVGTRGSNFGPVCTSSSTRPVPWARAFAIPTRPAVWPWPTTTSTGRSMPRRAASSTCRPRSARGRRPSSF